MTPERTSEANQRDADGGVTGREAGSAGFRTVITCRIIGLLSRQRRAEEED
jgi:hypothetical protein